MNMIYGFSGEFRFLSNFSPSPFILKKEYPTVEHYFQSMKVNDPTNQETIRHAKTPALAKRLARRMQRVDDWEDIKTQVMLKGLRAKFEIPRLRTKLLRTGHAILVEGNDWGDTFWGQILTRPASQAFEHGDGVGLNMLGVLLMIVREENRDS